VEQFEKIILYLAEEAQPKQAIFPILGVSNQQFNFNRFILPLINAGLVCQTIPDKPRSPLQKYALTPKAKTLLQSLSPS
jgi:ATP-dependent DNA helicase RecG